VRSPAPFPTDGVELTQLFVVSDLERSKRFYRDVLGASLYREYGGTSCVLDFQGSWLLLVTSGGPTEDKPTVTFAPPSDPNTVSHQLTIRVPDFGRTSADAKNQLQRTRPACHPSCGGDRAARAARPLNGSAAVPRKGRWKMNRHRVILNVALILSMAALGCNDDPVSVSSQTYSELSEGSFTVGDSGVLEVSNTAGKVEVLPGDSGVVHVVATKRAEQEEHLDQIAVEMVQLQNGVSVTTTSPSGLNNVSVDLEITVPSDMRPTLLNGAGGTIYEGRAKGECRFLTGAGSIELKLPADVNAEVSLSVGAGSIRVDFPVNGQVGENLVEGTIGTGADGRIEARVGAGNITVSRQ